VLFFPDETLSRGGGVVPILLRGAYRLVACLHSQLSGGGKSHSFCIYLPLNLR
jgi:hypothetical protein